jgi:GTP cyclohydrolase III
MFFMIDGDDVGARMDSHILRNDVASFVRASETVTASIQSLLRKAKAINGTKVVSVGGDSILVEAIGNSIDELKKSLASAQGSEGFCFSVGIGRDIRDCYIALRMAKASGKSKIVEFSGGDYIFWGCSA